MSALIIAPVLTRLYNSCISTGTYPRILKIGQIVPIHKGDAKDQCCNYRPYLYLAHLVRSLKNACTKEFTLI